jgi:hypothetical protein
LASLRRAFLKEEKSSMRGLHLTLNECHRNWRFYKLWLLIGLSFAILAVMNTGLDRHLGGLGTELVFVSSDGVFLPLFLL